MFDDYETTSAIMYEIRRPNYINISGSFALKQLLNEEDNISYKYFECNDIDLYVEILHKDFNLTSFLEFHNRLMDLGFIDKHFLEEYKDEVEALIETYSDDYGEEYLEGFNALEISNNLKIQCMRFISSKINDLITSYSIKKIIKSDYLEIEEIEDYINNGFCVNKFVKITNGDVYSTEYTEMDIIFISKDIQNYANNNFDLSIVKNYINSHNQIISMYKSHVINNISEYKFSLFKERVQNNVNGVQKFIERIKKYTERDFKIYMTFDCGCKDINCDDSLYLNEENIQLFIMGFFIQKLKRAHYANETIENLFILFHNNTITYEINRLAEIIILKIRLLWELKKILAGPKYIMQTLNLED